ncbi:MAG: hypothetical protein JNL34_07850 [Anaerolineae bacterium]|nr:hypothetical protein [Anaerolineae bacterium]
MLVVQLRGSQESWQVAKVQIESERTRFHPTYSHRNGIDWSETTAERLREERSWVEMIHEAKDTGKTALRIGTGAMLDPSLVISAVVVAKWSDM